MRTIRVLHVNGGFGRGGVETWLRQALVRLPRERYQCDICTYRFQDGPYKADLKKYGCTIHFIPCQSNLRGLLRFAGDFRQLLRAGRYDVVHCHGLMLIGFLMFLTWLERVPVRIGHSHNSDRATESRLVSALSELGLRFNRLLARAFATHGVGCSADAEAALFGDDWSADRRFSIIHCGIDLERFEPGANGRAHREELGIPWNAKVIGHVSNLGVAKNPGFLIEVAASVFRRREDVMLLFVGHGVLRAFLEQRCQELGIASRVVFAGLRPNVPELMCEAMDVYVMPSLHEGLPLVLLEAQAAGLPCIVSNGVSRESQVVGGAVQFLPLSAGAEAWADAVLSALDSHNRSRKQLESMKETDFNIAVSAKKLADLYDNACAGRANSN